jgi:hypothetical protein
MNTRQFYQFWAENFAEIPPINHLFKEKLTNRWLRIHSLPDEKRYAETEAEWELLKARQNTVFLDLMPEKAEIYLILQLFSHKSNALESNFFLKNELFSGLNFTKLDGIDYFELTKLWTDEGLILHPFLTKIDANSEQFQSFLTAIAKDEIRAFFFSKKEKRIIAPYDGGVDLVFENRASMLFYQKKYADWLPNVRF